MVPLDSRDCARIILCSLLSDMTFRLSLGLSVLTDPSVLENSCNLDSLDEEDNDVHSVSHLHSCCGSCGCYVAILVLGS